MLPGITIPSKNQDACEVGKLSLFLHEQRSLELYVDLVIRDAVYTLRGLRTDSSTHFAVKHVHKDLRSQVQKVPARHFLSEQVRTATLPAKICVR